MREILHVRVYIRRWNISYVRFQVPSDCLEVRVDLSFSNEGVVQSHIVWGFYNNIHWWVRILNSFRVLGVLNFRFW
jgi:hypothetical protein